MVESSVQGTQYPGAFIEPVCTLETYVKVPSGTGVSGSSAATGPEFVPKVIDCFSDYSVKVLVERLDAEPAIIPDLLKQLDSAERDKASRFIFERDRFRFIVGRARLRQALSAFLNVRPDEVGLVYGERGKPALAPPFAYSNLRFNVSHSNDVAVYAFSLGREVGVDIEAVRPLPYLDQIADRFFSVNEKNAYFALDPSDKLVGFFSCWTRKEAFIKALGDGLYFPLDSFDVSLVPDEPARILCAKGMPGDSCGWRLSGFSPAPGFVAAVVAEINNF